MDRLYKSFHSDNTAGRELALYTDDQGWIPSMPYGMLPYGTNPTRSNS